MNKTNCFIVCLFLQQSFANGYFNYFGLISKDGIGRQAVKPPTCGFPIKKCDHHSVYRRFDGSCTNPISPTLGMAGDTYISILPPKHNFAKSGPFLRERLLPLARNVKNRLFPDGSDRSNDGNLLFVAYGQAIAHDISRILETTNDEKCCTLSRKFQSGMHQSCSPITIPKQDIMNVQENIQCQNFSRAQTDMDFGCKSGFSPKQINSVTASLDLSIIYGSSNEINYGLRTFKDGRLKVTERNGVILPPLVPSETSNCQTLFELGDNRSNQNAALFAIHTLLIRQHNRIASSLKNLNPRWEDSKLFHEARRIMIAQYQYIAYYEWLPIIISRETLEENGLTYQDWPTHINDFDPRVNPSPSNEYAHAAFTYLHSIIPDFFEFRHRNGTVTSYDWASNVFCQDILTRQGSLEQLYRGMVMQPMASADKRFAEAITQRFERRGDNMFGTDLKSIDIQRGRDVGIRPYTDYKRICGNTETMSFDDFENTIPKDEVTKLRQLYSSPDAVELSVGGSLETHAPGSKLGPTFECLVSDQFLRTRVGDYLWFEHSSSGFSTEQVSALKDSSISNMMCNNADGVNRMPLSGFVPPNDRNLVTDCTNIPDLDYSLWTDTT